MKGMQKIRRGSSFKGVVSYVLNRESGQEPGQIIGGNLSGATAGEIATEFGASRQLRPDIEKPVWHNSLRLPEGERLDPAKFVAISDNYMERMGFSDEHQRVYVMHDDIDGQHVHIVASRVALDGDVYLGQNENLKSTKHIQALERTHNLSVTRGPVYKQNKLVMPSQKQMKKGEIEMAIRTGERPTRLDLQDLVNDALKEPCTAVEFRDRLGYVGVTAKPNIAQTGKMNGFSFEFKGVAFKGSSLGEKYKWQKLQERGLEYVKARDSKELIRWKEQLSRVVETTGIPKRRVEKTTTGDFERGGTADRVGAEIRADHKGPAVGNQHDRRENSRSDERTNQTIILPDPGIGARPGHSAKSDREVGEPLTNSRKNDRRSRGKDQPNKAKLMGKDASTDSGRPNRGANSGDWSRRFRAASAAKRRATQQSSVVGNVGQSHRKRTTIDTRDIRSIDPTNYLISQGFEVKKEGRHYSVVDFQGDEQYRLTHKSNGDWLWCDHFGNKGGDNLDLVKDIEPATPFIDRAYKLQRPVVPQTPITKQSTSKPRPRRPQLPRPEGIAQGRSYLKKRGISLSTIKEAEQQGMIKYCSDGVLFCGYDKYNLLASVTKRATNKDAEVQKKDFFGTDKSKPAILQGSIQSVVIVEGGVDALAVQDFQRNEGREVSTVIVTGGARVYSLFEDKEVVKILKQAKAVVLVKELEGTPQKQDLTDKGHKKQKELIKQQTGKEATLWQSPNHKDFAEFNKHYKRTKKVERYRDKDHGIER